MKNLKFIIKIYSKSIFPFLSFALCSLFIISCVSNLEGLSMKASQTNSKIDNKEYSEAPNNEVETLVNELPYVKEKSVLAQKLMKIAEQVEAHIAKLENRPPKKLFHTDGKINESVIAKNAVPNMIKAIQGGKDSVFAVQPQVLQLLEILGHSISFK